MSEGHQRRWGGGPAIEKTRITYLFCSLLGPHANPHGNINGLEGLSPVGRWDMDVDADGKVVAITTSGALRFVDQYPQAGDFIPSGKIGDPAGISTGRWDQSDPNIVFGRI